MSGLARRLILPSTLAFALGLAILLWWALDAGMVTRSPTSCVECVYAERAGATAESPLLTSRTNRLVDGREPPVSERLAHAVDLRGESDAVVRDFEALAMSACGRLEVITGRARVSLDVAQPSIKDLRADPWRSWALDYLERTCAGYDATAAMKGWRPELPDLALANREMGAHLATTIALDDLRNSGSLTELLMALDHLNRFGDFPEGVSLQRDGVESPARVFEFAVEPIRCGAMGSCRGDSLETALFCIDIGCPRGTTHEQILIAEMPAAEVAAGLALRQAIVRYRAKPH